MAMQLYNYLILIIYSLNVRIYVGGKGAPMTAFLTWLSPQSLETVGHVFWLTP